MSIWATGAAISFSQMLLGWASVQRLRQGSRKFQKGLASEGANRVELLLSNPGCMPITCGVFHPAIMLPDEAKSWSPELVRMVVRHEMAHVRRLDVVTQLLARIVMCLHWCNPLAWFAWREFLKEREYAADDLVLKAGESSSAYAGHLLDVVRSLQNRRMSGWPAVAMASRSGLEGRLSAILDSTRRRGSPTPLVALACAAVFLLLLAPIAAVHAQSDASLNQADAARDEGKYDQAKELYTKAMTTAANAATALLDRGTVELATKDYPAAIADFEQAQREDKTKTALAKMWLAVAQQAQGQTDVALASYRSALEAADTGSMDAAITMELYANLLQNNGRADEASGLRERALVIRDAHAKPILTAAQVPGAKAYHVGAGVQRPVLTSKVEPEYSAVARLAKYSGTALLLIEIAPNGTPQNIRIVRPLGLGLDEKAAKAVSQWRFQPGTKDGQAVTVAATIEITFRLL